MKNSEFDKEVVFDTEDGMKDKYLVFKIENQFYAIEIRYVTEIIGIQPITEIPHQQPYVKGVINLRGKIIPVIDVRIRMGKEFRKYDDRTCIIVVNVNDVDVGLIVDYVSEVLIIKEEALSTPPDISEADDENKFVRYVGNLTDRLILILDCEKLVLPDKVIKLN